MSETPFPALPADWEPTRATLHAYAHGLAALPRAVAPAHPKWWHASLEVRPTGLTTDVVPIPGGGTLQLRLDPTAGVAVVETSDNRSWSHDLGSGATGTEFGDAVLAAAAEFGVSGDVAREKFESDEPRSFDSEQARQFWGALTQAAVVMERHRRSIDLPVSPVQLWPHNFDLAFEAFGTRLVEYGDSMMPAQINFGFYPGGDAYFYANPWPFDEALLSADLPAGAAWHTDGWQGTKLPLDAIGGSADGGDRLLSFYQRVFEVAGPGLME